MRPSWGAGTGRSRYACPFIFLVLLMCGVIPTHGVSCLCYFKTFTPSKWSEQIQKGDNRSLFPFPALSVHVERSRKGPSLLPGIKGEAK